MSAQIVAMVRDRRFGDPAIKRVLECLAECVDTDGAGAFPDMTELAEDCELKHATIQRVLREARDAGLLIVTPAGGGVLRLSLRLDALLAQPLTGAGRRRFASPGGTQP